ncbi:hypothetical protein CcI49_29225 [Frankia sp. CcI49]|uniref:VMAP-C domain-containing protein n=1 Tax=Frankia sp. CcI49 TaxID=1745382 RepID=UPI00097629B8|nr:hypothetical protein [Frankia sp. CcI49]ONH54796.1 hypothetical protein CcI49_29225 [Frankia sp. CcI49]
MTRDAFLHRYRSAIERQIVDTLDDHPDLHGAGSRPVLLRRCAAWSGTRLPISDLPHARHWFVDLVGSFSREGRFDFLAEAVNDLTGDGELRAALLRLDDAWQAAEVAADAPEGLWEELQRELSSVPASRVADVLHQVTEGRHSGPESDHCRTAWELFVFLCDRSAPGSRLGPRIEFLEHLVHDIDQRVARRVEAWHQSCADDWKATAALRALRLGRGSPDSGRNGADGRSRQAILTLQLERITTSPDLYLLRTWQQWDGRETVFHPAAPPVQITRQALEWQVEAAVQRFERSLASDGVDARIEFILPLDLLGLRVESFRVEWATGVPLPLALRYPVVLRSLDRMRQREWHRAWRLRWRILTREPARAAVVRGEPADGSLRRLEARLLSDEGVVAVVFDSVPASHMPAGRVPVGQAPTSRVPVARVPAAHHPTPPHEQLIIALRCGIPGILWSYSPDATDAASGIHEFAGTQKVDTLPDRVTSARRAAFLETAPDNSLGGYLALLWDDPDRLPERGLAGSPSHPEGGHHRD